MARLFTFGCSFTQYMWPTWANIMAYDLELDFYNFGLPGLGNRGISLRMFEADIKYKFTQDDIICVLWSSWDREDRIRGINIDPQGSIFCNNNVYGKKWIKKFYDDSNKMMNNIYDIYATNKMYKDFISWQASGFEYYKNDTVVDSIPQTITEDAKKIITKYSNVLPKLFHWSSAESGKSFNYLHDTHPDIKKHLQLVETQIYPSLGLILDRDKKNKLIELHETIEHTFKQNSKNRNIEASIIKNIISTKFKDIDRYQKSVINERII